MPRPPIEYPEQRPSPEDSGSLARGVYENSRRINETSRAYRDTKTKTANYTMDSISDRIIFADGTNNTVVITLPDAAEADYTEYVVVAINITSAVTVDTVSGNINGSGSAITVTPQYACIRVASDGTNYFRTDIDV